LRNFVKVIGSTSYQEHFFSCFTPQQVLDEDKGEHNTVGINIFLLGRPGSGKSEAARSIEWLLEHVLKGWEASHVKDYKELLAMRRLDVAGRRFEASEYGGFKVIDFSVLPESLKKVNDNLLQQIDRPQTLLLTEFARNNYRQEIWEVFDPHILDNSYFLYLQADLDLCVKRVFERVRRKVWEDDTFVPYEILTRYYQDERFTDLQPLFGTERVRVVENNGEWNRTWTQVKRFLFEISLKTAIPVELVGLR
jgi:hypothetical protein